MTPLTERDKRFILRKVSNNPMISAVDLAADIPSTSATNVHAEKKTIHKQQKYG